MLAYLFLAVHRCTVYVNAREKKKKKTVLVKSKVYLVIVSDVWREEIVTPNYPQNISVNVKDDKRLWDSLKGKLVAVIIVIVCGGEDSCVAR